MLELKNLSFTVPESNGGRRNIIDSISFTFERGKFWQILAILSQAGLFGVVYNSFLKARISRCCD
jgi:hypothetical protein